MDAAKWCDIEIDGSGHISAILPPCTSSAEVLFDGKGHSAVIPGLVNAHTHISMTILRGLAEELPLMKWLTEKIFPIEDKMVGSDIRAGAELAMLEMIASGTTCFADMYYFMDEVADASIAAGMRASLCRGVVGDNEEKLAESVDLIKHHGRDGLLTVMMCAHAPYTVSMGMVGRIAKIAVDKGVGLHFHWLETESELGMFSEQFKISSSEYLERTGLLKVPHLLLAHSVWHPIDQLDVIARPNVSVVHNPSSNMKLGSGYAPIDAMLKAGVNVALGTDGASSNNRLDMWNEIRETALMHKGTHRDPTIVPAREVLAMATVNGARALGLEKIGTIEVGCTADLAVVDIDSPHYVGVDEDALPEFLVYAGSSADVIGTIVAGRKIYDRGEFLTIDRDRVVAAARSARKALLSR